MSFVPPPKPEFTQKIKVDTKIVADNFFSDVEFKDNTVFEIGDLVKFVTFHAVDAETFLLKGEAIVIEKTGSVSYDIAYGKRTLSVLSHLMEFVGKTTVEQLLTHPHEKVHQLGQHLNAIQ